MDGEEAERCCSVPVEGEGGRGCGDARAGAGRSGATDGSIRFIQRENARPLARKAACSLKFWRVGSTRFFEAAYFRVTESTRTPTFRAFFSQKPAPFRARVSPKGNHEVSDEKTGSPVGAPLGTAFDDSAESRRRRVGARRARMRHGRAEPRSGSRRRARPASRRAAVHRPSRSRKSTHLKLRRLPTR